MHHTITSKKSAKPDPDSYREKQEKKTLIETEYEPSTLVIKNILNYSKALSVRDSKLIESVEVVLN